MLEYIASAFLVSMAAALGVMIAIVLVMAAAQMVGVLRDEYRAWRKPSMEAEVARLEAALNEPVRDSLGEMFSDPPDRCLGCKYLTLAARYEERQP